ncbi:MAG TPA: LuxR C-terminal-related transcriptional regulator [Paraburkholderia sp.]|nr:LuxR C-terminal-related transcriptional regulator [Paraburkholderia sp.]
MGGINDSILSIYQSARNLSQGEFQAQALQILHRYAPFERLRWRVGLCTPNGLVIRTLGLAAAGQCSQIDDADDSSVGWSRVAMPRALSAYHGAARSPASLAPCAAAAARRSLHSLEMLEVWRRLAQHTDPPADGSDAGPVHPLFLALSLYRSHRLLEFSYYERKIAHVLNRHVSEAWSINLCIALQRQQQWVGGSQVGTAIATQDGTLLFGDPGFVHSLANDWPQAEQAMLPAPLLLAVKSGQVRFASKAHVFQFTREGLIVYMRARRKEEIDMLSIRELEVARHVASGLTHKEIARVLGISPSTVRKQIVSIHERMGVHNNAELASRLGPMLSWLPTPGLPGSPASRLREDGPH